MYEKGDFVNYGTQGICQVEDIRTIKPDRRSQAHDYYVLRPLHQDNASVFVPVDNQSLAARMRPVLSREEIEETIMSVKDQALLWVSDRKERTALFQKILIRRDERELLLLGSCLYTKARENPKGLSASDAQTLKKVESVIEQEFSFALQMHAQDVGAYIRKKLGLEEQCGA